MKKILAVYRPYMLRPIIYQAVTRFSVALTVALLWDKFINAQRLYNVVESAFFIVGATLFAIAWFNYLRLDGMNSISGYLGVRPKKKKAKRHFTGDIVDFVDEKIVSFDQLDDNEQIVCKIASSSLAGIFFMVPALLESFIF